MKVIFTLFAGAILLMMTGCKKDHTCTCSVTTTYISGSTTDITTGTETRTIKKAKKSDANMACSSTEYKNSSGTGSSASSYSYKTTCSLN